MEEKQQVDITVIMPALNEEDNVIPAAERSLRAFDSCRLRGELIVVNDGSSDRTPARLEEMIRRDKSKRIRLLHHEEPRGIGACFRDGLRQARGEAVVMMPGDGENDPGEIMRYFDLLQEVDLVVPFVYNREVRSRIRNALSALYRSIINLSFGLNFNYTNGTVLYRRSILSGCENRSDGFFFQTENVVRAARKGYLFAEVPCRLDLRGGGDSKALSLRSLKKVMKDYLSLVRDVYFSERSSGNQLATGSISAQRRRN